MRVASWRSIFFTELQTSCVAADVLAALHDFLIEVPALPPDLPYSQEDVADMALDVVLEAAELAIQQRGKVSTAELCHHAVRAGIPEQHCEEVMAVWVDMGLFVTGRDASDIVHVMEAG